MNIKFDIYRYQLLPIDRYFQGELFNQKFKSINELIEKKNDIFYEIIKSFNQDVIEYKNKIYKIDISFDKKDVLLLKIAPKRKIERENEKFQKENIDHWPSVDLIIYNNPKEQLLLVQKRYDAFSDTKVVVHLLDDIINKKLSKYNLSIFIEAVFKKENFWEIIDKYKDKIDNVKFILITPNMANISETLSDELKQLAKDTNTKKTIMQLDSDKQAPLHIEKSNKHIDNLVDYASKGGGDISIRVKGMKSSIKTSNSIQTIEIDEIDISGNNILTKLPQMIKGLFNG